jgi:hypothetical protein
VILLYIASTSRLLTLQSILPERRLTDNRISRNGRALWGSLLRTSQFRQHPETIDIIMPSPVALLKPDGQSGFLEIVQYQCEACCANPARLGSDPFWVVSENPNREVCVPVCNDLINPTCHRIIASHDQIAVRNYT